MFRCEICDKTFKNKSGLGGHVTSVHEKSWADYQAEYTVIEIPKAKRKPRDEADEEAEPSENHSRFNDRLNSLENTFNTLFSGYVPAGTPSGISDFPGEVIEVIGEKVNYKVALDPEIFSTYNKFKAVCIKRGTNWDKDFSDFLMMSVRTAMSMYGIYDMVVEVRGERARNYFNQ